MKSFLSYLTESKNLHMEHLEDAVFNEGTKGINDAVNFIKSVSNMLRGSSKSGVNITVKWDGAPAIFCGTNPENGKFFVGTKSVFNKTPKINYTHDDIRANHGGGLADRLHVALNHLPKLGIDGVIQGDMMFMNGDLGTDTINDVPHITFTPNTITYAVPSNSKLAKQISKARIGIVFHTKYTGTTMAGLKGSFGVDVSKLNKTSSVWFEDAYLKDVSGSATLTKKETTDIDKIIKKIDAVAKKYGRFADEFIKNKALVAEIKIYINANVREGVSTGSAKGFASYMDAKMQKQIEKLKSKGGKKKKQQQKDKIMKVLSTYGTRIQQIFQLHSLISQAKIIIVRKLEKVKSMGTFIKKGDGFDVTSPEGYVAIDKYGTNALKLVDRLEFSRQNFNAAKNWEKG
ncbi:MAG: hypothetical protein H8D80_00200 [Proteobacteria bacterium]|nr:hypothetical protein [Pseudomonadota bacterium]